MLLNHAKVNVQVILLAKNNGKSEQFWNCFLHIHGERGHNSHGCCNSHLG